MIDKEKFAFGTIDNESEVHIMPLDPEWGSGPACGMFYETLQIRDDLTINNVDCERCKKKLIYKELLPKADEKPLASTEELKSKGWIERPLFTPQEESYERPRLTFNAKEEIRCVFFTLVVKTDALRMKYDGGIKAFVEKYGPRCNRKLAVLCWMSTGDLEDPFVDIEECGLIAGVDYECFDAMSRVMGFEVLKKAGEDVDGEVKFPADWLKGYIHNGGIMIYYAGD